MYSLSIRYLTQLFYPSPITTINVSINRSVCTLYHQPTYLSALSSINLPFLSINAATHHPSIHTSIHPLNHPLSCLSIHPFNHHLSCLSIHLSLLPTYHLFLLSIYVIYHLSIYLSLQPTYLYQSMYLPIIYPCVYLSYLSIFISIHASTAMVLNWG